MFGIVLDRPVPMTFQPQLLTIRVRNLQILGRKTGTGLLRANEMHAISHMFDQEIAPAMRRYPKQMPSAPSLV